MNELECIEQANHACADTSAHGESPSSRSEIAFIEKTSENLTRQATTEAHPKSNGAKLNAREVRP